MIPRNTGGEGGGLVELPDDESKHARNVLRVRTGENVGLLDGKGLLAEAEVVEVGKPVVVRVTRADPQQEVSPQLDVAAAVPKGALVEEMVRGLSQLGAARWIPLTTERSVVDPREAKLNRLQRLAVESAKQCGRSYLLKIDTTTPFDQLLEEDAWDVKLIAAIDDETPLKSEALRDTLAGKQHVLVMIGPEGGWTEAEETRAKAAGALPIQLGPHVMRIETAACAAASIVRYATL